MTVLQALDRYYDRLEQRGDVVPPGWSVEPIGLMIDLAPDGAIVRVSVLRDAAGKRPRPERVPKWFSRSGTGSTPYFLWDNTAYVLGVSGKEAGKTARDHAAFKALHEQALDGVSDPGLAALRHFLASWTPDRFVAPLFTEAMRDSNVAFRLDGEQGFVHQTPMAVALADRLREASANTATAMCLVTGAQLPRALLHPKIKGVDGTASAEVPLVSFNLKAFESYGHEQGDNAPTSAAAAFRYGAALNRLLERGVSRNRLRIGDATVAFWADASGVGEAAAAAAEETVALGFAPPPATDDGADQDQATKLRDKLMAVARGQALRDVMPELDPGTRFHVLGLAPNAARLAIRYWLDDTFEAFARRMGDHWRDLQIEPPPRYVRPPDVQYLLLRTTALLGKADNIPPQLAGEVMRAVLSGTRYPRTWLMAAVMRLRAGDDPGTGWHAMAIRACLARDHRLLNKEDVPVSLDRQNANPAYQLGRLFAALEAAQRMALGRVNATIRDRYFGAASATPANVFPLLMRGVQNHLGRLRKDGKGGWIEREIEEITGHLPSGLPRSLQLEAQGRFVIGYYHQRQAQYAGRPADETEGDSDDSK